MKEINFLNPLNMNIPGGGFSSRDRSARLKKAVSELFNSVSGEGIRDSLFDEELSGLMAKSGGIALLYQMEGGSGGTKTGPRKRLKKGLERASAKRACGAKK